MKSLVTMLDEARGHFSEPDETSYALLHASVEWSLDRLRSDDVAEALAEGTVRAYTNPDGSTSIEEYEPGMDAVMAQFLVP